MIYLDSAATTLIKPPEVSRKTAWAINYLSSPGRGQYKSADLAEKIAFQCREKVAAMFNVSEPDNVVFTFNATHGLNMAINTLVRQGSKVVVSGYEHNAVMRPLKNISAEIIRADSQLFDWQGAVNAFKREVKPSTACVVCTATSNVFGYILPIEEISEYCRQAGVPLIIDASQAAGAMPLNFAELGAAFMAMPGHKGLYGPQGTGLLLCSKKLKPLLFGGTGGDSRLPSMPEYMPDAGEAGTHNMPGIAGLSAGIDFVAGKTPDKILHHERSLISLCASELKKIPGINVFSADNMDTQGGALSFQCAYMDCETLSEELGKNDICVRGGLHCAPSAHETVGTLETGTVRASVSAFTRQSDIYALINGVKKAVTNVRK